MTNRPLTDIQIQSLKQRLSIEKTKLEQSELDSVLTGDEQLSLTNEHADNVDESLSAGNIELNLALEGRVITSLKQVELALDRIRQGQYGVCIDCDREIPIARLEAFPAAARCIGCKQILEDSQLQ